MWQHIVATYHKGGGVDFPFVTQAFGQTLYEDRLSPAQVTY